MSDDAGTPEQRHVASEEKSSESTAVAVRSVKVVAKLSSRFDDLSTVPLHSPDPTFKRLAVRVDDSHVYYVWQRPDGAIVTRTGAADVFPSFAAYAQSLRPRVITGCVASSDEEVAANTDSTMFDAEVSQACVSVAQAKPALTWYAFIASQSKERFDHERDRWLDSACSSSIENDITNFTDLHVLDPPVPIEVAAGADAQVVLSGTVLMRFVDREGKYFVTRYRNVFFCPEAGAKLLATKQLVHAFGSVTTQSKGKFVQQSSGNKEEAYVQIDFPGRVRFFDARYVGPEGCECPAISVDVIRDPLFAGYYQKSPAEQRIVVETIVTRSKGSMVKFVTPPRLAKQQEAYINHARIANKKVLTTADVPSSRYDNHETLRVGYNPILDHAALQRDKYYFVEQKPDFSANQYNWQPPSPGDFECHAPTVKHTQLLTAGLAADKERTAEIAKLSPQDRARALDFQRKSVEVCKSIDGIMEEDGGLLGKVRLSPSMVVQQFRTPEQRQVPAAVPHEQQAAVKAAAPVSTPEGQIAAKSALFSTPSSPLHTPPIVDDEGNAGDWQLAVVPSAADGTVAGSPGMTVQPAIVLRDLQHVEAIHILAGDQVSMPTLTCNQHPEHESMTDFFGSIAVLADPPQAHVHALACRQTAFQRVQAKLKSMQNADDYGVSGVAELRLVVPRALYTFNLNPETCPVVRTAICRLDAQFFIGPPTHLRHEQLRVLHPDCSIASHLDLAQSVGFESTLDQTNLLRNDAWPVKFVGWSDAAVTDHFYVNVVDGGQLALFCKHDMDFELANKLSKALKFVSPILLNKQQVLESHLQQWLVPVTAKVTLDESFYRSVASCARTKLSTEAQTSPKWYRNRQARIAPLSSATHFAAGEEIVIALDKSHTPAYLQPAITVLSDQDKKSFVSGAHVYGTYMQLADQSASSVVHQRHAFATTRGKNKSRSAASQAGQDKAVADTLVSKPSRSVVKVGQPTTKAAVYHLCLTMLDLYHQRMSHRPGAHLLQHWDYYFPDKPICSVMHMCAACISSLMVARPLTLHPHRDKELGFFSIDVSDARTNPSGIGEFYTWRCVEMLSRYGYAYITKAKDCSTTIAVVHKLLTDVIDHGYMITHIKSDRGEFEDVKVQDVVRVELGASLEIGPAESSHSNAVVEHRHHVITRHAIANLQQARLKRELWPQAVAHSQLCFNHTVSTVLLKRHKLDADVEITPAR